MNKNAGMMPLNVTFVTQEVHEQVSSGASIEVTFSFSLHKYQYSSYELTEETYGKTNDKFNVSCSDNKPKSESKGHLHIK